ncbi:MAG: hypothetical protein SGJ27_21240 [Candidatus Melainabacteria bacterium]|nr:hypothetical protein [Candidatus Melainabacteria bacterium]
MFNQKKSFVMLKNAFNGLTLCNLISAMGFNKTGSPKAAAQFVHELLSLAPFYKNLKDVDALLPRSLYYTMLYAFTTHDVMEHGGSVGGSWLTNKGKALRDELDGIDWKLPEQTTLLEFPSQRHKFGPGFEAQSVTSQVSHRLDHCGCGCEQEAFDFTAQLLKLAPLKHDSAELTALVPDLGMRQFLIYHMTYLGLVDQATGDLTSDGIEVAGQLVEMENEEETDSED